MIFASSSCSDDDKIDHFKRVTDFEVPTLTAENTIQFEVTVENAAVALNLNLSGKKVAIDWGDNDMVKDDLTQNRGETSDDRNVFEHKYVSTGKYTVKVWSTELTELSMYSNSLSKELLIYNDLQIGNAPILETLYVESLNENNLVFPSISTLKKLTLYYSSTAQLDISKLSSLENLIISDLNNLSILDVSKNTELWELYCSSLSVLDAISFNNNNLTYLTLRDFPKMTSVDLNGAKNLVNLSLKNVLLGDLDVTMLEKLNSLTSWGNTLSSIDLSKNIELTTLSFSQNNLPNVDISKNVNLTMLTCVQNELTTLDVTKNQNLELVNLENNQLAAQSLNDIFTALPKSKYVTRDITPRYSRILVSNNPGYADCDLSIIENKGWIEEKSKKE